MFKITDMAFGFHKFVDRVRMLMQTEEELAKRPPGFDYADFFRRMHSGTDVTLGFTNEELYKLINEGWDTRAREGIYDNTKVCIHGDMTAWPSKASDRTSDQWYRYKNNLKNAIAMANLQYNMDTYERCVCSSCNLRFGAGVDNVYYGQIRAQKKAKRNVEWAALLRGMKFDSAKYDARKVRREYAKLFRLFSKDVFNKTDAEIDAMVEAARNSADGKEKMTDEQIIASMQDKTLGSNVIVLGDYTAEWEGGDEMLKYPTLLKMWQTATAGLMLIIADVDVSTPARPYVMPYRGLLRTGYWTPGSHRPGEVEEKHDWFEEPPQLTVEQQAHFDATHDKLGNSIGHGFGPGIAQPVQTFHSEPVPRYFIKHGTIKRIA